MPLFAFYAKDGPRGPELREAHRPAHLENMTRLDRAGRLAFAGPLKDGSRSIGSLIIFAAADEAAARAEMNDDPYTRAGVFASVEILPTIKVFPKAGAST